MGNEPAKLFQIILKTVQTKNSFIRRSESKWPSRSRLTRFTMQRKRDSPVALYRHDHVHKVQRSLNLSQVQRIKKVQQSTEVSQQQYMNVDVPAEMQCPEIQCQNIATHQNIVQDAQMQRQVQMILKMSNEIHRRSRTCWCSVPAKQRCSRQVQCCRSRADDRRA